MQTDSKVSGAWHGVARAVSLRLLDLRLVARLKATTGGSGLTKESDGGVGSLSPKPLGAAELGTCLVSVGVRPFGASHSGPASLPKLSKLKKSFQTATWCVSFFF